eukprot:gene5751-6943_t
MAIQDPAESAFFVVDVDEVVNKLREWQAHLPRVTPYYAVKCNPDVAVLQTLAQLGCNFDCASKEEISNVLALGVSPSRIIYANPCKQPSHLRYSRNVDVNLTTFDCEDELHKIYKFNPKAELLLRISVDDSSAVCNLSCKYGALPSSAEELLTVAKRLGLNVRGVSFHVGSGCKEPSAFVEAVKSASQVFTEARQFGLRMDILDVGGGFPGMDTSELKFKTIAQRLNGALDSYFPHGCGVRLIAEPGRFLVSSSHTLAVNVIGRKASNTTSAPSTMYFVNDGVYGSFNCLLYDHAEVEAKALKMGDGTATSVPDLQASSVWGPTCDGLDCIVPQTKLPQLQVGDWLYFENMGAYTSAAGSRFNGMELPGKLYMASTSAYESDEESLASA